MDWLIELFTQESVAQTILLLAIISIFGLAAGKVKIGGISLGSCLVFFAAILVGHFAGRLGIRVNTAMMDFAKNFGLVIFVYTLGLQCGPSFFSSLRKGGIQLNLIAIATIVLGSLLAVVFAWCFDMKIPESVGLLSGAVTSTPSLISAQQTVLDMNPGDIETVNTIGAAYAVGYPFSILSVILVVMLLRAVFSKSAEKSSGKEGSDRYTAVGEALVLNRELFNKTVKEICLSSPLNFVISRVWRDGAVQIPVSDTVIREGDRLMYICDKDDCHKMGTFFGHEENTDWNRPDIDWNKIDLTLVSKHIRVTKDDVAGHDLGDLKLRNKYGVNITRIYRAGITLVPDVHTVLEFGDRLTVVGSEDRIKEMAKFVGDEERRLDEPHLIPLLTGIFLGVLLGSIPFIIPGIAMPVKLGIAGGPIIMGILMGAFGHKIHLVTYTSRAASLMLGQLGITFFFASLGFSVGGNFVENVFCLQGLKWAGLAVLLAAVPLIVMGVFNEKVLHLDFAKNVGTLCGIATNPNALAYANSVMDNDNPAAAYATVYPLTTFLRVFVAQLLIILLS